MVKIHKYTKAKSLKSDDAKLKGLKHILCQTASCWCQIGTMKMADLLEKEFFAQNGLFFWKYKSTG